MSPNVGNFVHDLVEMAKAMETLPQVEAALRQAEECNRQQVGIINSIQADLEQSRTYAATLEQKVRTVEAERDDAEIRFLEVDDRMLKLERTFQKSLEAADEVDKLIQSFKPAPPQPELVVEALPQGSSEALPTTNVNNGEEKSEQTSVTSSATGDVTFGASSPTQPPASQDQSEINPPAQPSASTSDTPNDAGQAHATTTDAGSIGGEGSGAKSGSYTGKRYHDHPVYVPYWDWIDGGGTKENYYWSPNVGSSA